MSKEDIDRAVAEAEKFADEDKKIKEAVDVKNEAEALLYQSDKTLEEAGDKISESDKTAAKAEADKLREALKSNDTETIKVAIESFKKAYYEIAEKLYKANAAQGGADVNPGAGTQNEDGSFNADFTEKK